MEQEQFESDSFLDDEEVTFSMNSPYQKMEEHIVNVYWKIKKFIYETGEYDLLSYFTFDDMKNCLYNRPYYLSITTPEENPL